MRAFLGWLLSRGLLYLALVAAFAAAPFARDAWVAAGKAEADYNALGSVRTGLQATMRELGVRLDRVKAGAAEQSTTALQQRIDETGAQLAREQADPPKNDVVAVLSGGVTALRANEERKLRIVVLERELKVLQKALVLARAREAPERLRLAYSDARPPCLAAIDALRGYEATWRGRVGTWVHSQEHRQIAARRDAACASAYAALKAWRAGGALEGARRKAAQDLAEAGGDLSDGFRQALVPLDTAVTDARIAWAGTARQKLELWAEQWHVQDVLWHAFLALLLIVATPYIIRLLFWFVFAPLAERRPSIRLSMPGGEGAAIPLPDASATSVGIRLNAGEELLVRQDFLQTIPLSGTKATRWFLDWRHPLSSLLTGLTFLTQIRGDGDVTTISATRDPFAEVTVLTMSEGTSLVLQPRALAAVVQPIARPLRITTHWRWFSLHAWLTLQLRYLVFHGPCRLVVKGGRGARVELAERGRVFGQDQLVGFSADLTYSVIRAETFWPYLLGREQLFKDKVEAGRGLLVIEEAPLAGLSSRETRRGLEGAFDVLTKAVGL